MRADGLARIGAAGRVEPAIGADDRAQGTSAHRHTDAAGEHVGCGSSLRTASANTGAQIGAQRGEMADLRFPGGRPAPILDAVHVASATGQVRAGPLPSAGAVRGCGRRHCRFSWWRCSPERAKARVQPPLRAKAAARKPGRAFFRPREASRRKSARRLKVSGARGRTAPGGQAERQVSGPARGRRSGGELGAAFGAAIGDAPCGRQRSPCGRGNHAGACGQVWKVDRSVSRSDTPALGR